MNFLVLFFLSFVGLLAAILFAMVFPKKKLKDPNGKVYPGPSAQYFGGNVKDVMVTNDKFSSVVQHLFEVYGPLVALQLPFMQPLFFVNSIDGLKQVLSGSYADFPKEKRYQGMEGFLGKGLVTANGQLWKKHRHIISPAFHAQALRAMIPVFANHAARLVLEIELKLQEKESGETNLTQVQQDIDVGSIAVPFYAEASHTTADIICETGFGYQLHSRGNNPISKDIHTGLLELEYRFRDVHWIQMYNPSRYIPFIRAKKKIDALVNDIIEQKKKNKKNNETDLLDLLMEGKTENGDTLSKKELLDETITFLTAGHETTSILLYFTMALLSLHPHYLEQVHKEIDQVFPELRVRTQRRENPEKNKNPSKIAAHQIFGINGVDLESLITHEKLSQLKIMESVLNESLRLNPPAPAISRTVRKDVKVGEYIIPANSVVLMSPKCIQNDSNVWKDPEKFIPERFDRQSTNKTDSKTNEDPNIMPSSPFAFIPFSQGPRKCIGQLFAMLEAKTILCILLSQFTVIPPPLPLAQQGVEYCDGKWIAKPMPNFNPSDVREAMMDWVEALTCRPVNQSGWILFKRQ